MTTKLDRFDDGPLTDEEARHLGAVLLHLESKGSDQFAIACMVLMFGNEGKLRGVKPAVLRRAFKLALEDHMEELRERIIKASPDHQRFWIQVFHQWLEDPELFTGKHLTRVLRLVPIVRLGIFIGGFWTWIGSFFKKP